LKVEDFLNTLHGKYMMISFDTLIKPKTPQEGAQRIEGDIRVRTAEADGVFCYTFFKALGAKPRA
jgi:hypothetical protein